MADFLFLMHDDVPPGAIGHENNWTRYIARLQASGHFQGGSAIGEGLCARRAGAVKGITSHLVGYIRVRADSLDDARALLVGNPVFEAGGTVEIRALPQMQ